ncbi:MAG: SPOR domain-containing protein [Comamonadaceae bacterium]|nr:SPOR domain-containing protein [Comamonadaceae bacterium]
MLRLTVWVLVLLNLVYFGWGQGWLQAYGLGPATQTEPQRLEQQIRPQAIVPISDVPAASASALSAASASSSVICLQSSVLDEEQAKTVRLALAPMLPATAWTLGSVAGAERWIVYMGKYASSADLIKKRAQLASLRLTFYPLVNAALEPGLSLGAYESEAQARAALDALSARGVRTATVLRDESAAQHYRLRLPAVDDALQTQLPAVMAVLPDKSLAPCAATQSQ